MAPAEARPVVLLVEQDPVVRARVAGWIHEMGSPCLTCAGPSAPDFGCAATAGSRCPLADAADIVVLNMETAGDVAMKGTAGWELLIAYETLGKPIVALASPSDPVQPQPTERLVVLQRPIERAALTRALSELARPRLAGVV